MPYPVTIDPKVVRQLHRRIWAVVDAHLLWAFNPQRELVKVREH